MGGIMMTRNFKTLGVGLGLLILTGWMVPKITGSLNGSHPDIQPPKTAGLFSGMSLSKEDLFHKTEDGFVLRYQDESGREVLFPRVLNSQTPVVYMNRGERVPKYVPLAENRMAEMVGGYLVYSGRESSLFYWYDEQNHELKTFVRSSS